jgi:hypothetical protein
MIGRPIPIRRSNWLMRHPLPGVRIVYRMFTGTHFVGLLQELHDGHFGGQVHSAADLDQHLSGVGQGRLLRIVLVEAYSLASFSV